MSACGQISVVWEEFQYLSEELALFLALLVRFKQFLVLGAQCRRLDLFFPGVDRHGSDLAVLHGLRDSHADMLTAMLARENRLWAGTAQQRQRQRRKAEFVETQQISAPLLNSWYQR